MNNQKPTQQEKELAAQIAQAITQAVFASYEGRGMLVESGKRAPVSRTTLAQAAAQAFLAGCNHGKSTKGVE